jgi:hypothetical protein
MIYNVIIERNLLVRPDSFYHLYFLLEIYYFLEDHLYYLWDRLGGGQVHRKF